VSLCGWLGGWTPAVPIQGSTSGPDTAWCRLCCCLPPCRPATTHSLRNVIYKDFTEGYAASGAGRATSAPLILTNEVAVVLDADMVAEHDFFVRWVLDGGCLAATAAARRLTRGKSRCTHWLPTPMTGCWK
jgi:hypothetical protein